MKKMVLLKLLQWPQHEIIQKYCKIFKSIQGHQEHVLTFCKASWNTNKEFTAGL